MIVPGMVTFSTTSSQLIDFKGEFSVDVMVVFLPVFVVDASVVDVLLANVVEASWKEFKRNTVT